MTVEELFREPDVEAAGWSPGEKAQVSECLLNLSALDRMRQPERALSEEQCESVRAAARRCVAGEPLAYVLGVAYFDGLLLKVSPAVLIPRPDTEVLLEAVTARLPSLSARVLDLGTGSGAVALALKHRCPDLAVTGSDVDADALAVACDNGRRLGLEIEWRQADGLQGLPRFELIASNPPYIGEGDPWVDPSVDAHEPHRALYSGADGLELIRTLIQTAQSHLVDGGWLCLEHGWTQKAAIQALSHEAGWEAVQSMADLAGRDRVTVMRKPDAAHD